MSDDTTEKADISPFVDPNGMMMSDVLERLLKLDLPDTRRRDLRSAIRSVCRLVDRAVTEVPANINWVHVRLRRVHPIQAGISKKRLKNIKSDVIKALEVCGASRDRADWLRAPSPDWKQLMTNIPDKHDRWKLSQLAQFCTGLNVEPQDVTDAHIKQLLQTLEEETFVNKPASKVGSAVSVWNKLRTSLPHWPQQSLKFPRAKEPWTIPLSKFPQSFQDDVDQWLNRLANPDILSADGPMKPVRKSTIKHRRFQIQEIASAIMKSGVPIKQITDLSIIVDLTHFKAGLRYMMGRFDDKPTEAIHGLAMGVTSIAKYHVKADDAHVTELKGICKRLNLEVDGLRPKNQERLAQLDDDENLARLLHLPGQLLIEAKKAGLRDHRRALLVQAALAIEILLHAPMRVGNLCRLHLDRHIKRIRIKGADCILLSIPGHEVKNNKPLMFELDGDAVSLFDFYMAEHRPTLLRTTSSYVFPAQNGEHKAPHAISDLIKSTIFEFTGLTIHAHLFRSIAGKVHCMIHPGDFLTLGHAIGDSLRTAMKSYAQFEQQNAVRHYQASVTEARRRLRGLSDD